MADNTLAQFLKAATDNMNQVAEAEVRLAAAGQVSLSSWEKQAAAVRYLTEQINQSEKATKAASEGQGKLGKALKDVQTSAVVAGATLTATGMALHRMAGQANPGLLQAWDGSLAILQARIGRSLLPTIETVIGAIEDVSDWFDGLSETEKKLVAAGALVVPAVIGLGHAVVALGPAMNAAAAGVSRLVAAANGYPAIGAAASALGAAGTAVMIPYLLNQLQINGPEGRPFFGTHKPEESGGHRPTEKEMNHAWDIGSATGVEDREKWNKMSLKERREYAAQVSRTLQQKADAGETNFLNMSRGYSHINKEEMEAASRTFGRYAKTDANKPGFVSKDEQDWQKRMRRQGMLATAVSREGVSHYSPLDQARKQLQTASLNKNPYEQELLKEQRKTREAVVKELKRLVEEGRKKGFHVAVD